MVRLADLHEAGRQSALDLDCPSFTDTPFVSPKPLAQQKVAIVSTAGLIARGDAPFRRGDTSYRIFDDTTANDDILVSHISINLDRVSVIRDIELMFPRDTLAEIADGQAIGEAANEHYSFLGSSDPLAMEEPANSLAAHLHQQGVDSVVLLPV